VKERNQKKRENIRNKSYKEVAKGVSFHFLSFSFSNIVKDGVFKMYTRREERFCLWLMALSRKQLLGFLIWVKKIYPNGICGLEINQEI